MHSLAKLIFVSLTAASLAGCATDLHLQMIPTALDGQELVHEDGFDVVTSEKVNTVAVKANMRSYASSDDLSIFVRITNGTGKSVKISPASVQVTLNGVPHRVYDFEEMLVRLDRQRGHALWQAGLHPSGRAFGDPSSNEIALRRMDRLFEAHGFESDRPPQETVRENRERYERENAAALKKQKEVEKKMLKPATLAPGKTVSGSVFFAQAEGKTPEALLIRVTVRVGGESHTFEFNQRPIA